ncbi:MAG TPA: cytochrome c biogenesis protein DipZ [Acidimicrobiales bacterium]|nr:cytochrome c biogenesis protein DipZ [Acidimicrobiales bacterium]
MAELLVVAFLGGLITGLSPCIVPVLPVIAAGGATGSSRSRPYLIIAGLVVSFSLAVLVGVSLLSALGLPQSFLRWMGITLLFVLAGSLLFPALGTLVEKPFNRLGGGRYATRGGGFALGLSLGLVFVPCAGPVLGAISAAAANHHVNASSLFVTLFYSLGAAIPLLVLAIVAQRATTQWLSLRNHLPAVRRISGVVLAGTTLVIALGGFDYLQTHVPGYTTALENNLESSTVCTQLQQLSGERPNQFAAANAKLNGGTAGCSSTAASTSVAAGGKSSGSTKKTMAAVKSSLPMLGRAPGFTGIAAWLNTPGSTPLTLAGLKGKVVLIDFWTYSCINCQRALPHVEGWYNAYKKDGLVVVGVSTPEFAFEHVVSNVRNAAGHLGVDYPIAVDNNYGTWDAYNNQYWPAEYLIDSTGEVRAYDFGEGGYSAMENNIRSLLTGDGVMSLPARTDVANKTPTVPTTPESYLGYDQLQYAVGTAVVHDKAAVYHAPSSIPSDSFAFNGTWTDHHEEATAGNKATLLLHFTANDVYLVIGGHGTVDVSYNGRHIKTVDISGIPTLYTLFSGASLQSGLLSLSFSPGVEAYDFTFG